MPAIAAAPDWNEDGVNWPLRDFSQFVETDAYRWHVQRLGAGPPILLVHGTGAASHSWAGLATRLADHFEVISFDLPGHGFTQTKRRRALSLNHVADSVAALTNELGIRPAGVVGHSAGAAIMVRMIATGRMTPRIAIGINGALSPFPGVAGFVFPLMAKAMHYNPFTAYFLARGARSQHRVKRLIAQTGSQVDPVITEAYALLLRKPAHIDGALGMMAHWDLTRIDDDLRQLGVPALFLAGSADKAVPPDTSLRAAELAPEGKAIVLSDYGHLIHEEAPDEIAQIIADSVHDADTIIAQTV